jgi:hypothetical protein
VIVSRREPAFDRLREKGGNMRTRFSKALLGVATLAVVAAFAAPVGGAAPGGGCPTGDGWTLDPVALALPEVDNGNFGDQNGDGLGCHRSNAGQTKKHDGFDSWTWKDNTNKP